MKNILLTGGNGFLGSFILKKLLGEGFHPILLLRSGSDTWRINDFLTDCTVFRLKDSENDIKNLFDSNPIDAIIHTATDYGRHGSLKKILETNLLLPIQLLEEGLKGNLSLFINTDSFFAKKEFNQTYLKDYTNSKRILEQSLMTFSDNLKIINLRLEHVYGENDTEEKFFTSIIKKLLSNTLKIQLTEGLQKRDFVYAGDVANAYITIIKSFDKLLSYQEFEVGTGKSVTIREFVEHILVISNSKSYLEFGALETRHGDIPESFAKIEALKKLGWRHQNSTNENLKFIIKKEKQRFNI